MHPFYGPSARLLAQRRTARAGAWSMAAYLGFWALTIPFALVMLRRALGPHAAAEPDTATRLLRERLARGEVDVEEYRRLLHVLDGG